ncbi:MAG: TetR/AcrR family transcriptional regulator [Clostridia bacterium]|nr:TetR/AcrR family transcriptional regulator [Clostridia bacterium]
MNTKDKILLAMYKLIARHGYEKTSIAMICEEVKIKKPSVYYYFDSKEEIFLALIDAVNDYYNYLNIEKSFKKQTFKKDLIREGHKIIDDYIKDGKLIYVIAEFYIQANRIDRVKEKIKLLENSSRDLIKRVLKHGIKINALPKDFDVVLNSRILGLTIDAIGFSFSHDIDAMTKIWETSVNRMFLELERQKK